MNDLASLRTELRRWLRLTSPTAVVAANVVDIENEASFERRRIAYCAQDGSSVPAFLLVPKQRRAAAPAVVLYHQHNGERHLGKSEVCGLVGDPLQAFGPALAEQGFIVLAPDSICFEDRRTLRTGTLPDPDDWLQHYNEMSYRLLRGDTLMRKVLEDAEAAVSLLVGMESVDPTRLGILGHSYGGNTVLFQAALDERVRYVCTSGAVCSFRHKIQHGTGIEMAEILPGALDRFEIDDLLKLAAPRRMLVVSAIDDQYSADADEMVRQAAPAYLDAGVPAWLEHKRYQGGHGVTRERFDEIVDWLVSVALPPASSRGTPRSPG